MLGKKLLSHTSSSASMKNHPLNICGDCGAPNPCWASINRGILLCSDCCSVHRSLGRHISQIKCAKSGSGAMWIPEQLTMVHSLFSCGANSIWEYSLLNPADYSDSTASSNVQSKSSEYSKMRKPRPSDPLHPTKSDFIRAKHLQQAFVFRPSGNKEDNSETELSRQLHGAVRTNNLETSLRLLSQGANPNYFHPEKNNSTALHIACKSGQAGQVELLLVYGSDPGAIDKNGRTPSDYAKTAGYHSISQRVLIAQYEVSDRLSFFLCQRRPDHNSGQHFIVPETSKISGANEEVKLAKRKLQMLSNHVFEELAMDVYDEVDRRETDSIWNNVHMKQTGVITSQASTACLPFLPVNPDYGTSRNQARQKLARLSGNEFTQLVIDVLKEIRRRSMETTFHQKSPLRENPPMLRGPQHKSLPVSMAANRLLSSNGSDDEPIYDHVASDDDYYNIPDTPSEETMSKSNTNSTLPRARPSSGTNAFSSSLQSSPAKSNSSGASGGKQQQRSLQPKGAELLPSHTSIGHSSEFLALKQQLENSEQRVQALIDSNDDMRSEISRLSSMVNKLVNENHALRGTGRGSPFENEYATPHPVMTSQSTVNSVGLEGLHNLHKPLPPVRSAATVSMFDQQSRRGGPQSSVPPTTGHTSLPIYSRHMNTATPTTSSSSPFHTGSGVSPGSGGYHNYYEDDGGSSRGPSSLPVSSYDSFAATPGSTSSLPSQEEVVRRTEAITRCIQELLVSAKDEKFDAFIPCSERIVRAVTDMVSLFPETEDGEDEAPWGRSPLGLALADLMAAAQHFESECRLLIARSQKEPLHQGFVTQQVIQCAFDIAKSTKQLVAMFQ